MSKCRYQYTTIKKQNFMFLNDFIRAHNLTSVSHKNLGLDPLGFPVVKTQPLAESGHPSSPATILLSQHCTRLSYPLSVVL